MKKTDFRKLLNSLKLGDALEVTGMFPSLEAVGGEKVVWSLAAKSSGASGISYLFGLTWHEVHVGNVNVNDTLTDITLTTKESANVH